MMPSVTTHHPLAMTSYTMLSVVYTLCLSVRVICNLFLPKRVALTLLHLPAESFSCQGFAWRWRVLRMGIFMGMLTSPNIRSHHD